MANSPATSQAKRSLGATRTRVRFSSPVPEILIVTEAATARGFRTVRIAIERSSARNAAANRAAALGGIGSRGVGSRIAVGAIGLCVGALHPNAHSENARAYDTDQGALHRSFPSHTRLFRQLVDGLPVRESRPFVRVSIDHHQRCGAPPDVKARNAVVRNASSCASSHSAKFGGGIGGVDGVSEGELGGGVDSVSASL